MLRERLGPQCEYQVAVMIVTMIYQSSRQPAADAGNLRYCTLRSLCFCHANLAYKCNLPLCLHWIIRTQRSTHMHFFDVMVALPLNIFSWSVLPAFASWRWPVKNKTNCFFATLSSMQNSLLSPPLDLSIWHFKLLHTACLAFFSSFNVRSPTVYLSSLL